MNRARAAGLTPIADDSKTVGLISLAEAMTGMILTGMISTSLYLKIFT